MVVNGKSTKLPFAPIQKGGDWLVPADGLAKAFGGSAKLDNMNRALLVMLPKA
jgi:hypothetical protein